MKYAVAKLGRGESACSVRSSEEKKEKNESEEIRDSPLILICLVSFLSFGFFKPRSKCSLNKIQDRIWAQICSAWLTAVQEKIPLRETRIFTIALSQHQRGRENLRFTRLLLLSFLDSSRRGRSSEETFLFPCVSGPYFPTHRPSSPSLSLPEMPSAPSCFPLRIMFCW